MAQSPRNTTRAAKNGKRHTVNPRLATNNRPAPHTRPAAAHARRASTLRDPLWPLLHLRKEGERAQSPRNTKQDRPQLGKRHAVNPRLATNNRPAPIPAPPQPTPAAPRPLRDPLWPLLHLRKEGERAQPPRNTKQGRPQLGKRHTTTNAHHNNRPALILASLPPRLAGADLLRADPPWPLSQLRNGSAQAPSQHKTGWAGGEPHTINPRPTTNNPPAPRPSPQLLRASFENWFKRRVDTAKPRAYSRASVCRSPQAWAWMIVWCAREGF